MENTAQKGKEKVHRRSCGQVLRVAGGGSLDVRLGVFVKIFAEACENGEKFCEIIKGFLERVVQSLLLFMAFAAVYTAFQH